MSFGGGHITDFINRAKYLASRKTTNRDKFKKNKYLHSSLKLKETEYDLPKLTDEELHKLKIKLQQEAKEEQKKQILTWALVLAIPLIIIFIIVNFLSL